MPNETKCPGTFREVLGDNTPVRLLGLVRQELEKRQHDPNHPGVLIALQIIQESFFIAAERVEREAFERYCPYCTARDYKFGNRRAPQCAKTGNKPTFDTCPVRKESK